MQVAIRPSPKAMPLQLFFGVTQTGYDCIVIEYELLLSRRGARESNGEYGCSEDHPFHRLASVWNVQPVSHEDALCAKGL
jgi:hypothetical protein